MSEPKPPCECVTKGDDGLWICYGCDCQNANDLAEASAWAERANSADLAQTGDERQREALEKISRLVEKVWACDGTVTPRVFDLLLKIRHTTDEALAATEGDGWRSMESAPRDGTVVLLDWPYGDVPCVMGAWHVEAEGWQQWPDGDFASPGDEPAGWRPLPARPTDAEDA